MVASGRWNWIFMFHPKLDDEQVLGHYRSLAERYENANYLGNTFDMSAMQLSDAMLCDSSSIIMEFMLLDKPVVTFRNSMPGAHLMDVTERETHIHFSNKRFAVSFAFCRADVDGAILHRLNTNSNF